MEGVYLQRLAMMLPASRQDEAETLMGKGYRRALDKDGLLGGWVEWLLVTGKREQAVELLQERFSQAPRLLVSTMPLLAAYERATSCAAERTSSPARVRPRRAA